VKWSSEAVSKKVDSLLGTPPYTTSWSLNAHGKFTRQTIKQEKGKKSIQFGVVYSFQISHMYANTIQKKPKNLVFKKIALLYKNLTIIHTKPDDNWLASFINAN